MKNLYVGNLAFSITEEELQAAFETYGQVSSVSLIRDRMTGQPRGFGFVEMPNDEEAERAIAGLNGKEMGGRAMNVNEARPREERAPRGGGFGGGGGGFGRGGGGGRGRGSRRGF